MEYKTFTYILDEAEVCRIRNLPNFARIREEEEIIQQIKDTNCKAEKEALLEKLRLYLRR
jgi:DNA topoisomerase VI subunit A